MLTKWVGQAWEDTHKTHGHVIRRTFRQLGLSLAVDGSEDQELSIRDLPGMEIGDWEDDVLLLDLDKEEAAVDDDAEPTFLHQAEEDRGGGSSLQKSWIQM